MGIKPEHLSMIFDPYFSTKQTGSGLGLSAAYSIVRKHQGLIDVESRIGHGTTFRIWLPVAEAEEPTPERTEQSEAISKGHRVLFMDDDDSIREMTASLLRRLGMEVVSTADGEAMVEAFRLAHMKGTPFELVITDLTVPGRMGGKASLPLLKEIDPEVRVVVSSGYSSDPILADYTGHGFWGMVAKPYKLPELRKILQEAFGRGTEP
ncbi:MAG: response regulator [Candidatus Synoicihabitans palmerolidicus]|nr:response regulator [Candidatus Synoicihabitans palmerolidicus]